jgi:hypothetical protein
MYGPSRLDGELEPEEEAEERDDALLESEELSELAWEVELFKQPRPLIAKIETKTMIRLRTITRDLLV